MKLIWTSTFLTIFILLTSCAAPSQPAADSVPTDISQADMFNPASVYCEEQGNQVEIRTAADGGQAGYCIFPDGSECDEWAYLRGECGPARQTAPSIESPTAIPIDPSEYQGWWTYSHPVYHFSIMLPDGWVVNEVTSNNPLMNGHTLALGGQVPTGGTENIRMTFRRVGEDVPLWPTGAGPGEFIKQGTLDIAGQPAQRKLLVCQTGEVTSIWYHDTDGQPNITRGDLEFGLIFQTEWHCEPGHTLTGKVLYMGEMIIASLRVLQ